MFVLAVNTRGEEEWKQLKCVSTLADGKCDGCTGRPMAEAAGVCVGVKGMLASAEDQKKSEGDLSTAFDPKVCASSFKKGFSQSTGMLFSLWHKTLRLLKLHF